MFRTLAEIDAHDARLVGGKALNCARLARAGFRVPDGLVVTTEAADHDLERLPDHPWIAAFPATQRFAVRSSGVGEDGAGHSFAGVHDTLLNVERVQIPAAVRACLLSVVSPQARAYRTSHGLDDAASSGVLIQPMIDAVVSGVAFTVDPVSGADDLVVDCAPGLGDDLVSGRIEPDRYRLRKRDRTVLERHVVAGRQPLSDAALDELAAVLVRIEHHYAAAQDVEWAADRSGLWILQARPITTTAASTSTFSSTSTSTSTATSVPATPPERAPSPPGATAPALDTEWSRANLAEVFPDQMSPQALDGYDYLLNQGQRQFARGLLGPEAVFGPPFKVFGGRMYINLSQLRRATTIAGTPASAMLRSLGHAETITPDDEIAPPLRFGVIVGLLPDLLRLVWRDLRAPQLVRALDVENAAAIARLAVPDPQALDDRTIVQLLMDWRRGGPDHMVVILTLGSLMVIEEQLRKALRTAGADYDQFVYAQLAAGEPSVSTKQAFDLVAVADVARRDPAVVAYLQSRTDRFDDYRTALAGTAFLAAFDRFLDDYGHRGLYESDWALPRFREDPAPLLFAIRTHVQSPPADTREVIAARLARAAADAWAGFEARLTWWQRLTLAPRVRMLVTRLKQRYVLREHCRSALVRVLAHARRLQLVLASRFADRGWIDAPADYFFLLSSEIAGVIRGEADPGGLRAIVAARQRQRAAEATLTMPLYMRQSDVARVLAPPYLTGTAPVAEPSGASALTLTGLCVSRGTVEAEVVVIRDPREFARMRRGAILVAPATDPSWTPLFTLAAGVIVEVGGMLSHASTVAREYGLPALANVKHATTRLSTGDRVRLDASAGVAVRCARG